MVYILYIYIYIYVISICIYIYIYIYIYAYIYNKILTGRFSAKRLTRTIWPSGSDPLALQVRSSSSQVNSSGTSHVKLSSRTENFAHGVPKSVPDCSKCEICAHSGAPDRRKQAFRSRVALKSPNVVFHRKSFFFFVKWWTYKLRSSTWLQNMVGYDAMESKLS